MQFLTVLLKGLPLTNSFEHLDLGVLAPGFKNPFYQGQDARGRARLQKSNVTSSQYCHRDEADEHTQQNIPASLALGAQRANHQRKHE